MAFDSSTPIWVQLVDDVSRRIVLGTWPPGSKVPSVRDLALEWSVNPNTVQRALSQTDADGLTITHRGLGRVVTDDVDLINRTRQQLAQAIAEQAVTGFKAIGLDQATACHHIHTRWESPASDQEG